LGPVSLASLYSIPVRSRRSDADTGNSIQAKPSEVMVQYTEADTLTEVLLYIEQSLASR